MKLKHYISKFLTLFSVVALLATNLFADNLCNEEITISTRNGTSNIGGSIDLTSGFGSTTTLGFGYSHSNSDRSLNLYSSYNAPSLLAQVHQGVHGINHITMDPNLALHKFSSAAILQMTTPRDRMDMDVNRGIWIAQSLYALDKLCQVGASQIVQGIFTLGKVANDVVEKGQQKAKEMQSVAKSTTGGQLPDPDDEERKKNCGKNESPVWNNLKPHKGKYKTDSKGDKIYDWDHTHNDIEVYNSRGDHLGSMDPVTGVLYKGPKHNPIKL